MDDSYMLSDSSIKGTTVSIGVGLLILLALLVSAIAWGIGRMIRKILRMKVRQPDAK